MKGGTFTTKTETEKKRIVLIITMLFAITMSIIAYFYGFPNLENQMD